eukprot:scaffold71588_cov47-Attheya_sp.AAC.1
MHHLERRGKGVAAGHGTNRIIRRWLSADSNRSNRYCFEDDYKSRLPRRVKIVEVGARDGLQNEAQFVSTDDKVTLITKLVEAGCRSVEVTSFVSPKWVPAMADAKAVMERIHDWRTRSHHNVAKQNVTFSCLVPNAKGFHGAFEAGTDEVAIFGSASEAFSQKNINCSIKESIDRFRQVADLATAHNIPLRGYVSCVLGCPYQGHVSPSDVARVSEQLLELGCHEISLGDTIGVGTPLATVMMLEQRVFIPYTYRSESFALFLPHSNALHRFGINYLFELPFGQAVVEKDKIAVHMHDTFGQALANIHAALLEGISTIDSSVAGLGGCPYADGASGNVASEDVVYMLHGMGIETGIDLDRLINAGNFISGVIGRQTRSKVAAAMKKSSP